MPTPRRFELEDAVARPGTYFNPATEMLLVVDDSASLDADVLEEEEVEESEWILVSDRTAVDETSRDELLDRFSTRFGSGPTGAVAASEDDEEEVEDLDELGDITDPEDERDEF